MVGDSNRLKLVEEQITPQAAGAFSGLACAALPGPPRHETRPASGAAKRNTAQSGFVLLVSLLAVVAGGKAILFDTIDPDCFWHLRVAEQLQAEGIHPLVDRLSFSSIQEPWTPYSWLAELGMKAIWDAGGYRLALLVQAAMQAAFVVLLA